MRLEGSYLLLDCGEGAQRQLSRYGLKALKISHVFITHLHGDHYFGLPGLVTSMALFGRSEPLIIVGPPALSSIMQVLITESDAHLPFEILYTSTQCNEPEIVVETEQYMVTSIPLKHRIPCTGFIIKEKGPERKLNVDACTRYQVPVSQYDAIKWGADFESTQFGLVENAKLTTEGHKNRTYAYITDTIFDKDYLMAHIKNVDLLYHEATFLHEREQRAQETYHSTAKQAAQTAKEAVVKQLMIGHFSARYNDATPLLEEARSIFPNTIEATEGVTLSIGDLSSQVGVG